MVASFLRLIPLEKAGKLQLFLGTIPRLTPPTPQLHPGRRSCLAATRAQAKMCGHAGLAESMILAALIAGPPPQCRRPLPAVALVAIPSPIAGVRSSCSPHAATAAPRR